MLGSMMRSLALSVVLKTFALCAVSSLPVIIDTDIGTDFDDSVALALAVQSSILDVRLIVTATGDTTARARIVAKYLTAYGRDSIPIGIGIPDNRTARGALFDWAKDYNLADYKGGVFSDGLGKMASLIMESEETVEIIAIAPATNFPPLLQRFPDVIKQAEVKAMSGSVYRGYDNSSVPDAEYNVKHCPPCSAAMYEAKWNVTLTPLDTCGVVTLSGNSWDVLLNATNNVASVLMESWIYWCLHFDGSCSVTPGSHTDVFYDPVAVYLCFPESSSLIDFETLKLRVTDDGHTVIDKDKGSAIQVALSWKESGLEEFELFLASAIASGNAS